MPAWHPVDTVLPVTWAYPTPGTEEQFAEIRYLPVKRGLETVWRLRAVKVTSEPRELIGYYGTLADAAMACHRSALAAMVKPEKNVTPKGAWGAWGAPIGSAS